MTHADRGILDTSVVIAHEVAPLPGLLTISAVTLAELHFGVLVARLWPLYEPPWPSSQQRSGTSSTRSVWRATPGCPGPPSVPSSELAAKQPASGTQSSLPN